MTDRPTMMGPWVDRLECIQRQATGWLHMLTDKELDRVWAAAQAILNFTQEELRQRADARLQAKLDQECPACNGTGLWPDYYTAAYSKSCTQCKRTGPCPEHHDLLHPTLADLPPDAPWSNDAQALDWLRERERHYPPIHHHRHG